MAGPENGETQQPAAEEANQNNADLPEATTKPPAPSAAEVGQQKGAPTGRAMRPEGQRNLQESSFSISSEMDDTGHRCSIRVCNPPGGKSSGGFW